MLRRDFLSAAAALAFTTIRSGFAEPTGPEKNILDYGAKPDGKTLSTKSIQHAIEEVSKLGGGTVRMPSGTFLTGRINLKSRVTLYLDSGATLLGSMSLSDYNGPEYGKLQQRHLIFAADAEDVTVAGPGRIDGQGPSFWEPSDRAPLPVGEQWRAVASHALKPKSSGRPSPMVYFVNCRRLKVVDIRLENSPGWTLNAVNCDDVEIHRISIRNSVDGPNTDGIDLTGCQNAHVSNCTVETGDDAICLKSVNPYGPEPRLVRNIVVTGCSLTTCCNGFKIGTESQGGFENITFSDSTVFNKDVPFKDRVISGVALEVVDGGWIDGVVVTGIQMQRTRAPIFIHMGKRKPLREHHGLRNVRIENIDASDALLASSITGLPGTYAHNISLSNVHVSTALPVGPESVGSSVPEKPRAYPEAWMFGMLPASGLFVRHARDIELTHIALSATAGEARSAIILDDVLNSRISGLSTTPVSGHMPIVELSDCQNIQIADSPAPAGTKVFVGVEGSNSRGISLVGDDLRNTHKAAQTSNGASPSAVTVQTGASRQK